MRTLLLVAFISISSSLFANKYITPGTGVNYTLNDLVTNSSGVVSLTSGIYLVNDTVIINNYDTLTIATDATVKYVANTYLGVRGNAVLLINPPTNVTFTANDPATGYLGIKLDTTNATVIRKLKFEYAVSLKISDCSPLLDSCIIQYNNNSSSTSFGNGAISLFRANPVIKNCSFISNQRAAIQGGSNINNAPKILNNYFFANNTTNSNVPQINLGATSTGNDTCKIIGNTIIGGNTNSGAIGFLPIGNVYTIINGNSIRKNRYGITLNGGSNINAVISYNLIDSNNIQNDPALGGSGIAFSGGSATSQQNSIVTGNIIRRNLWGITIQNRAKPNLGNLSNSDTTDDGKNQFSDNTNSTTANIDLYNNTVDNISAENNFWNTSDINVVETKIFHQPDNASLGLVDYDPILSSIPLPVTLTKFEATLKGTTIKLNWQTETEINTSHFNVQRSLDGKNFTNIAKVTAVGAGYYEYNDAVFDNSVKVLYYRLESVDKDGKFTLSEIRTVNIIAVKNFSVVPNPATDKLYITGEGLTYVCVTNLSGKTLAQQKATGTVTTIDVNNFAKGIYIITTFNNNGVTASMRVVKR